MTRRWPCLMAVLLLALSAYARATPLGPDCPAPAR